MVPKDEGQAASLASYQLDVLRDKNRELTRRLNELYANAQENERLKALLETRARLGSGATAVTVLYTGRDAFQQKLVVDKGRDAGVVAASTRRTCPSVFGSSCARAAPAPLLMRHGSDSRRSTHGDSDPPAMG